MYYIIVGVICLGLCYILFSIDSRLEKLEENVKDYIGSSDIYSD